MNTSSSARRKRTGEEAGVFPYPEVGSYVHGAGSASQISEEEQKRREAATWKAGHHEGETQALASLAGRVDEVRSSLVVALDQFSRERHEYYLRAERELVQLALSIARKILRRESTIDPLLLAGMVRVLLERMDQSTKTIVRVSPQQVSEFRNFFARQMQERQPEVLEDTSLEPDRCVVQTDFGTTEIGPEIQLNEIEQGLLDLEAARPHIKS
jgi:flagellar biosynthesis/type III secretory pathway protein FliH